MSHQPTQQYRSLLWLVIALGLATVLPGPGNALRELRWSSLEFLVDVRVQHVMLASLLLSAGLSLSGRPFTDLWQSRLSVSLFTIFSWLIPWTAGLVVIVCLGFVPNIPVDVRMGVLIVACMPVANSTAGWAKQVGANLPLTLAVLLMASLLTPLATGYLIRFGAGLTGLPLDSLGEIAQWNEGLSFFFLVWVFTPMISGIALSQLLKEHWMHKLRPLASTNSLVMLLGLNYVNGTACLPNLVSYPHQFAIPLAAVTLLLATILAEYKLWQKLSRATGRFQKLPIQPCQRDNPSQSLGLLKPEADELALLLMVVMRNTGAAMVYTATTMENMPLVSLVIVFYTLLQHLMVGVISAFGRPDTAESN